MSHIGLASKEPPSFERPASARARHRRRAGPAGWGHALTRRERRVSRARERRRPCVVNQNRARLRPCGGALLPGMPRPMHMLGQPASEKRQGTKSGGHLSGASAMAAAKHRCPAYATRITVDCPPSGSGWSARLMRFRPPALAPYNASSAYCSSVLNECSAFTLTDTPPLTVALT
jgi:hypothetical protein